MCNLELASQEYHVETIHYFASHNKGTVESRINAIWKRKYCPAGVGRRETGLLHICFSYLLGKPRMDRNLLLMCLDINFNVDIWN